MTAIRSPCIFILVTTTPESIITIDQNTRREITWNVDLVIDEADTLEAAENGWTHTLAVSRPKGRRSYVMFVRMNDEGQILRHSTPKAAF